MISKYVNAARSAFHGVKTTLKTDIKQAKSASKLIGKKETAKLMAKRYGRRAKPTIKKYGPGILVGGVVGTGLGATAGAVGRSVQNKKKTKK
tara:strand:+ start:5711 stop:5986 length:276 start_codon:yes stop_codon:yes gene_type:complete